MQSKCAMFDSFFRNDEETRAFYEKLHDKSKNMIIFLGAGGNGKTLMSRQLLEMYPNTFSVLRDDIDWSSIILPSDKKIICELNVLDTTSIPSGFSYDVVVFPKCFH